MKSIGLRMVIDKKIYIYICCFEQNNCSPHYEQQDGLFRSICFERALKDTSKNSRKEGKKITKGN